ncbi:Cytospin-A [Termitomyces sp. J132]|nr:Cytospin-A [Termitomyces sp. J132]
MSVFNIGINDVSDQERAFKDKIASKDGHITALKTQLSRQDEEMQEIKDTYNENLRKLAGQTSRVVELENELKAQSNMLSNEKLAFHNADQSLVAARATIKQRELDARELEVKLDQLSHLSDEHKARADKLAKDKSMLEARVRELQAALPQTVVPPITPRHRRPARSRSRSASPSRDRVLALEREIDALRSTVQQKESDVMAANEKTSRAQEAHIRLGNEKVAVEKKMEKEIAELKAALEENRDEMRTQLMDAEVFCQREKELEERIDADEARYQAIVKTLRDDMIKAKEEIKKLGKSLVQAEGRHIELVTEKEAALRELEIARNAQLICQLRSVYEKPPSTNGNATQIDNDTALTIERLLAATTRLRNERDTLIADRDDLRARLDFLQAESKFELEALNAKLTSASTSGSIQNLPDDTVNFHAEIDSLNALHRASISEKNLEIRRLGFAVTSCGVVVQHFKSEAETLALCAFNASSSRDEALEKLAETRTEMGELLHRLQQTELNMELNMDFLKENSHKVEELRAQLEAKDSELEQTVVIIKSAEEAQEFYKKQYDDAESQRSSLALEITNLNNELSVAKEELKAAESRYIELQSHQFDSMSKTGRMRVLQNELMEERARVGRRDDHINMLQNDIKRMETTLLLQEDRLSEMTTEIDAMTAEKDAMVDDCADAREARDNALMSLEEMEMAMETQAHEGDRTVEALVEVLIQTVGDARDRLREARQSTIALAVSQVGLDRALGHIRTLIAEKDQLHREVVAQRNDMDRDLQDNQTLAQQLKVLQAQAAAAALGYSEQTGELQRRIEDLEQTLSSTQARHDATVAELVQSKEQLSATLQETQRSLAENNSNEEMSRLQEQYVAQLAEARIHISESERALEELHASHAMTTDELQQALEDAKSLREQLDLGVAQSLQDVAAHQDVTNQKEEEMSRLRADVTSAQSKQEAAETALEELKNSFNSLTTELNSIKAQHEESLTQSAEEHASIRRDLQGKVGDLQTRLEERSRELDNAVQERLQANCKFEEEVSNRRMDRERHQKELEVAHSQSKDAESALAQLQEEIESTRTRLEQSTEQIGLLQDEKLSLQEEITTLGAEVQKSNSLKRYLESQVKESEGKIASHVDELERVRTDLARAEKAANTAEVNLSLQGAQHKREMSELNQQLVALQAQPNLQSALAELEERNDEMEELLRKKCVEIEENDDRALEMLKENKKLTSKVESLTRKVQTLQTKLAAAKASIPAPVEAPANPTSQPSIQPSTAPPVPSISASLSSAPPHAPSSAPRKPSYRAVSGPSSLPRPRTPEQIIVQHPPVFKAKTPERKPVSSPLSESASSSSIGKKRRAPDDFGVCESLAPQGFTTECVPSQELSENITTTPHRRRVLSGLQSGFTPVRNRSRPVISMPSPKRLMTMKTDERPSPIIADVTNSLRGQSSKTKRSWLGKIRGASSQATNKPAGSRPRLERDTS